MCLTTTLCSLHERKNEWVNSKDMHECLPGNLLCRVFPSSLAALCILSTNTAVFSFRREHFKLSFPCQIPWREAHTCHIHFSARYLFHNFMKSGSLLPPTSPLTLLSWRTQLPYSVACFSDSPISASLLLSRPFSLWVPVSQVLHFSLLVDTPWKLALIWLLFPLSLSTHIIF